MTGNGGGKATVLVASNRGPVSVGETPTGSLEVRRGGGGLVTGLESALRDRDAVWVCAALSEFDRRAARGAPNGRLDAAGYDVGGAAVRMLDIDPATFRRAYNGVANSTLWFLAHQMYDAAHRPSFDHHFRREWASYVDYDGTFAAALAEEAAPGASVLVQDYHLSLTPRQLRELRPDLRISHFSHTPWAAPSYFRMLPDDVAEAVLLGLLGADVVGFHSQRWADFFLACCDDLLGVPVDRATGTVTVDGRPVCVEAHGFGIDRDELVERSRQPDVEGRLASVREIAAGRRLLLRIDRTELSKNIVRGLEAYRELLRSHPEWLGRVVHLVFAYPSRHDLPEYREYTAAVQRTATEIIDEFATPDWMPLRLEVSDDYPRSLAAFRVADVLVVNPIRDGMNLVAKEGPVLSEGGCALVLSREAGCADTLGDAALLVNPYDVLQTAEAMHAALSLDEPDRAERTARLAAAATVRPPQQWFEEQLARLDG